MHETNRARQAFEDYFNMGPGRSLRVLFKQYRQQNVNKPPTKRFETLALWSTRHGWQDRIREREIEIATAQFDAIKNKAIEAGYAFWPKRVQDLCQVAEKLLGLIGLPGRFSPALVREYRSLLGDIAAEMGERTKSVALSGPDGGPLAIDFGAAARDSLLGRLLSSSSLGDEGKEAEGSDG